MKKLLLSSIIMFGICGFVTAQNATDAKLIKNATKQQQAPQTSFTTATDVKTAATDQQAAVTSADKAEVPSDMQAQSLEDAKKMEQNKVRQAKFGAVEVDDAGVVVDDATKKQQMKKAEAAKAAAAKKTKDN